MPEKKMSRGANNIFYKKRINYQLSLCFGIRWLYYKTMASGSVVKGIAKYNGGGDKNYMKKIRKTLTENKKSELIKGKIWKIRTKDIYM